MFQLRVLFIFLLSLCIIGITKGQVIPLGISEDSVYFNVPSKEYSAREVSNYQFYIYKPSTYDPLTSPILFAIHGDGGTGMNAIQCLDSIAERRKALIIAPSLQSSGSIRIHTANYHYTDSLSFCTTDGPATDVFRTIYQYVLSRENRVNVPAYLIGFSAGGQFVTRYMLIRQAYPDSIPIMMAVSTSPAYYSFPTETFNGVQMAWGCGLNFDYLTSTELTWCDGTLDYYSFDCNEQIIQYYNENYGVLIGSGDNQPYLTGQCLVAQGISRYERAVNFYNFADSNAINRGTSLQWQYEEVPGIGHDMYWMYNTKNSPGDSSTIAETLLFDTPYHTVPSISPQANFFADDMEVMADSLVQFTNTSSQAISFQWDFGDGYTSSLPNPSHSYNVAGYYTVKLIAYNTNGCGSIEKKLRYINVLNSVQDTLFTFQTIFQTAVASTHACAAEQLDDLGYIMFGNGVVTKYNNIWQGDIFLTRLDFNGDTLWTRFIGSSDEETASDGIHTSDNGYAIIGQTSGFGVNNNEIYLIKTDSLGIILWSKIYTPGIGSTSSRGLSIKQTPDYGFVFLSQTGYGSILIRVDEFGDTLFTKRYDGIQLKSISLTSDSGFIVTGYTYVNNNQQLVLSKINSVGSNEWYRLIGDINHEDGISVSETSDKGFIIGGTFRELSNVNWYQGLIAKTDSIGNLQWSKIFNTTEGIDFRKVGENGFGNYFAVGHNYLLTLNITGDTLWTKAYTDTSWLYYSYFIDAKPTLDGGFLISGSYNSGQSAFLVKTDSNGNSGCEENNPDISYYSILFSDSIVNITTNYGCTINNVIPDSNSGGILSKICSSFVGIENLFEKPSSFLMYPNPTTEDFTLKFDQLIFHAEVKIRDALGRELFSKTFLNVDELSIDVNFLRSGIHFVSVLSDKLFETRKLLVVPKK